MDFLWLVNEKHRLAPTIRFQSLVESTCNNTEHVVLGATVEPCVRYSLE